MFFCIEVCLKESIKQFIVEAEAFSTAISELEEFLDEDIFWLKIHPIKDSINGVCEFHPKEWFVFQ